MPGVKNSPIFVHGALFKSYLNPRMPRSGAVSVVRVLSESCSFRQGERIFRKSEQKSEEIGTCSPSLVSWLFLSS